jgi:uncharacterized protein YcbK (DUF882 family)
VTDEEDTDPVGMIVWPGLYFGAHDFDCHDGTPYPTQWIALRLVPLVRVLDAARERWGAPIQVVSGYRTPEYNARIHGARLSQHPAGRAADVRPVPVSSEGFEDRVQRFHQMFADLWDEGSIPQLGGLGYYPSKWVHVDVRDRDPIGHLAQWTGTGIGSEVAT